LTAPLLSLIIPTRERSQTLGYTIDTTLAQASRDYEVVVSDNASLDDTEALVRAIDDDRIRYFRTERRLSMCDNYEFALTNARGRYVIFIGDDDAALPGRIDDLLIRLRRQSPPLIHMWPLHIYDWPSEKREPRLAHLAPNRTESTLDLRRKARAIMNLGGWRYYGLPSPYHCAIPTLILDGIRARTGRVFHSTQPDVFTAMAIPAFADHAIDLGVPVTFHGRSSGSNGADFGKRGGGRNIDRFISEYGDYHFHDTLPSEVSATAKMIPDAILTAKEMFPEVYEGTEFDYAAMWAYMCRLRFASTGEMIRQNRALRNAHNFNLGRFLTLTIVHKLAMVRRKVLDRLGQSGKAPDNIRDLAWELSSYPPSNRPKRERHPRPEVRAG
jgi:hypothetical protein